METATASIIDTPHGQALNLTGHPEGRWPRKAKLVIRIDEDCDDPIEGSGWKMYDFTRRGRGDSLTDAGFEEDRNGRFRPTIGLRSKLKAGTAHMLDLYEHGSRHWSLAGGGMQCQWDTSRGAGLLVYEDDVKWLPKEKRQEYASNMLEAYNSWANGDCYGYILKDADTDEEFDSCWGYIGRDSVEDAAREALKSHEYTLVDDDGNAIDPKAVDTTYPRRGW